MAADKRNEDRKLSLYSFGLHRNEAKLKETGEKQKNRFFSTESFVLRHLFRRLAGVLVPEDGLRLRPLVGRSYWVKKKLKLQPGFVTEEDLQRAGFIH